MRASDWDYRTTGDSLRIRVHENLTMDSTRALAESQPSVAKVRSLTCRACRQRDATTDSGLPMKRRLTTRTLQSIQSLRPEVFSERARKADDRLLEIHYPRTA
jgi:hypothetical protein